MEYYNPIDNSPKWYAAVITVVVMAIIAVGVSYITIEVERRNQEQHIIEIEYVELEEESVEEVKSVKTKVVDTKVVNTQPQPQQAHEKPATESTYNQTSGKAEETQTINQNALFKPTTGNTPDEDITEGNRLAPEGDKEEHKGEGTGLNVIGDAVVDGGLRQRGVVGGLPRPEGNNVEGVVIIAVVVDSDGKVISASVQAMGTTTTDPKLRKNAEQAALKTKFKPDPNRLTQSGTITYKYRIK